jgi:quercetin dioxygenase-like cupin family protein
MRSKENAMPSAMVVSTANAPWPLKVVGEQITVLASGAQTGGCEIFRQAGPEGSGTPPHRHPWDECFYVIKGGIAFGIGEREFVAAPGTLVHLPAGTTHWSRLTKGGGEMVSMTSREGASQMFADMDREILPEQPDVGALTEVGARYGLDIVLPGG